MRKQNSPAADAALRWVWVAGVLLHLALAGCGPQQSAENTAPPAPSERVAGERQEDETAQLVRQAGLPESFQFGGRIWKAHQVHRISADEMNTSDKSNDANKSDKDDTAIGNPPGTTDGLALTPDGKKTATTDVTPGSDATKSATNSADTKNEIAGFIPVLDLKVGGHQIYRKKDADEAVTDNIYLKADATSVASGSTTTGTTGTTPDLHKDDTAIGNPSGTTDGQAVTPDGKKTATTDVTPEGTASGASTTANKDAAAIFVEYDASGDTMKDRDLNALTQSASLPATIDHGGKSWAAKEVVLYDADVFDTLKPAGFDMSGHPAFVGHKDDEIIVMSEVGQLSPSTGMPATGTSGTTATETTPGTTTTDTTTTNPENVVAGPIFIKYEAAKK
jgi:hypothetical protein